MLDLSQHDFTQDELPPNAIHDQLKAHDMRMKRVKDSLAQAKAFYMTRWWRYIRGRAEERQMRTLNTDVEVNRLWGAVGSYLSALYPRANRAVFNPDATGRGSPEKTQLAMNHWLGSQKIHARVLSALRQSIIYPGCAAKIGYNPGNGNPLDRVWLRIIPWWEVVLDADSTDWDDERFRGHVYYKPVKEVEKEYGVPAGLLAGTSRKDYLSPTAALQEHPHKREPTATNAEATSDQSGFVRVLEICNLKDNYKDPKDPSVEYRGRFEVYVLEQGDLSRFPIWVGPLPLAEASGDPLPHIAPLIFASEPEFPLRGIAGSSRMLPQLREINIYRSFMAQSTRKDSRQYLLRDGLLGADTESKLAEGVDGLVLKVPSDYNGSLQDVVQKIETGTISVNVQNYMALAENDLERAIGTSPNARGIVTKATAFEMQTTQLYTESEFGLHGMIKDAWLAQVVKLAQRALIAAMQNPEEGSLGEYGTEDQVSLTATDAEPVEDPTLEDEAFGRQALQSTKAALAGSVAPFIDGPPKYKGGNGNVVTIRQDVLTLHDRGEQVLVTVQDLDADFGVEFVEGGRTPMSDAAMQQNLVTLMQPYMGLWQQAQDPGPLGVMARSYMRTLAERFELPKDLHPDNLEQRMKHEKKEEAAAEGAAPPQAPTAPPEGQQGLPPGPMPEEVDVEGEDPRQHVEMAAGVVDTLLNAPNLAPEVQDALVQVGEALLEAGKAEDPQEMAEELVGAMRALAPLAQAKLEPDLKEILDELAEHIDAALKVLPAGEAEPVEEDGDSDGEACPVATQDIAVNLENRQHAIDTAQYGPPNPKEPNDEYWGNMAKKWGTSIEEARTMRCGNCAAFIRTPKMLECIQAGLAKGDTKQDAFDVIVQAELGYCEAFDFKCAASRTCSAWVAGGPVTKEASKTAPTAPARPPQELTEEAR